jgi:hypothetical protein
MIVYRGQPPVKPELRWQHLPQERRHAFIQPYGFDRNNKAGIIMYLQSKTILYLLK